MVRIDIPGEGRQRPVRHPDGDRRHVFERVRHREQQDVHRLAPAFVVRPAGARDALQSLPPLPFAPLDRRKIRDTKLRPKGARTARHPASVDDDNAGTYRIAHKDARRRQFTLA
jgi:hypothetical protein